MAPFDKEDLSVGPILNYDVIKPLLKSLDLAPLFTKLRRVQAL
jgi:hypothetical protein